MQEYHGNGYEVKSNTIGWSGMVLILTVCCCCDIFIVILIVKDCKRVCLSSVYSVLVE